jgi:RNA polymerase-binding transcription factor DksA
MSERQMEFAERLEESFRDKALADVRARAEEAVPQDFDGKTCYDCGEAIPVKRLALSKFRCVGCQETKERGSKGKR